MIALLTLGGICADKRDSRVRTATTAAEQKHRQSPKVPIYFLGDFFQEEFYKNT